MHFDSTVMLLLVLVFANAWTFGQSLAASQLESSKLELLDITECSLCFIIQNRFSRSKWSTNWSHFLRIIDGEQSWEIAKDLSASGYVYKQLLYTTSNGTFTDFLAFIRTRKSRLPYRYRLFVEPSTSDALLKQVSAQGARGFRFKTYLGNATAFFLVYVRDSSRPLAKYIYRHAPCVSNRDELFVQISKNAAEGYRVLDSFLLSIPVCSTSKTHPNAPDSSTKACRISVPLRICSPQPMNSVPKAIAMPGTYSSISCRMQRLHIHGCSSFIATRNRSIVPSLIHPHRCPVQASNLLTYFKKKKRKASSTWRLSTQPQADF